MPPPLPADVLHHIFRHLRRPLPPAHTKLNDRSCLRQPELLACLRVCRGELDVECVITSADVVEWYNTAAPILYKFVTTDDFPGFLYCYKRPGALTHFIIPGIISKASLLGFTQRLFIEYAHKSGVNIEENDDRLTWIKENMMESLSHEEMEDLFDPEMASVVHLACEVRALSVALDLNTAYPNYRNPTSFTRLRTLSVGAFFGHEEEDLQEEHGPTGDWDEYGRLLRETRRSFCQFVSGVSTLQQYCQAPPSGALSITAIGRQTRRDWVGPSSIAFHRSHSGEILPHPIIGIPLRWYIHTAQWQGFAKEAFHDLSVGEYRHYQERRDELALGQECTPLQLRLDLTVYHGLPAWMDSPREYGSPTCLDRPQPRTDEARAEWRIESVDIERAILANARPVRKGVSATGDAFLADKLTWKQLFDAPPCDACGWRYEE